MSRPPEIIARAVGLGPPYWTAADLVLSRLDEAGFIIAHSADLVTIATVPTDKTIETLARASWDHDRNEATTSSWAELNKCEAGTIGRITVQRYREKMRAALTALAAKTESAAPAETMVEAPSVTPPWRCRNCGFYRNSLPHCAGCDLTQSEGDARD